MYFNKKTVVQYDDVYIPAIKGFNVFYQVLALLGLCKIFDKLTKRTHPMS